MQAVILAAGTGSRLRDMTKDIPKALIQVAGKPLLAYAVAFAQMAGCSEIVIVVGAYKEKVLETISGFDSPKVQTAVNENYLIGNLYSLGAARDRIRSDFLLLNTDHVYRRKIAKMVGDQCKELTAFCDQDRKLGADDMKVSLGSEGKLEAISKQLTEFDRGYVGMTYCPELMLDTYFQAFDRVARRHGDQAVVEMVLGELADSGQPVSIGDISGVGWLEIDTPDEHANAQRKVLAEPGDFSAVE